MLKGDLNFFFDELSCDETERNAFLYFYEK